MNEFDFLYEYDRTILTPRRVGCTVTQSMRHLTHEDVIRNELVHRLEAYVLADHIADDTYSETVTLEYPATTWQMFKRANAEKWWLRWLVERRPVRMATEKRTVSVTVERYLSYPEANISVPSLGYPVIFETARKAS